MMRWIKALFVGIGLAALVLCAAGRASAQDVPRLVFVPTASEVPLGTDFTIELAIEDGVDLNAFDVTVTFDEAVLDLLNYSFGDYFANLATVSVVNVDGSLRVAATQLATDPVSGDGTLLVLSFNARGAGMTALDIENAEMAGPGGEKTLPETVSGSVLVTVAPTYSPTVTVTPTATVTPTGAFTPLPTWTSTGIAQVTATRTSTPMGFAASPTVPNVTPLVTGAVPTTPASGTLPTQAPPSEAALMTETALGLPMPSPGSDQPDIIAEAPQDDAAESTGVVEGEVVLPGTAVPASTSAEGRDARAGAAGLWAVLIGSGIALVAMLIVLMVRKTRKEKDLLL